MKYISITILILVYVAHKSSATSCNEYEVNQCMDPFKNKYGEIGPGSQVNFKVDELCVDYGVMDRCFSRFKDNCEMQVKLVFEGLDNAMGYLCGRGKEVYRANKQCLVGIQPTHPDLTHCMARFNLANEDLQKRVAYASDQYERENLKRDACSLINEMFGCTTNIVRDECDDEAAMWYRNFLEEMMKPTEKIMNCSAELMAAGVRSVGAPSVTVISLTLGLLLTMV